MRRSGVRLPSAPPNLLLMASFHQKAQPSHGLRKKCWIDGLNLPHGRDEKQNNQPNTFSVQHPAPDLQLHSGPRGLQDCAGNWSGGEVTDLQALEPCREPTVCAANA